VNATYAADLATLPDGPAKTRGIAVGQAAARGILARRSVDGATRLMLYTPETRPGDWQPTPNPVPFDPPAAGDRLAPVLPGCGMVAPFVLRSSSQFEPDGPPPLDSKRYTREYNEVIAIGKKFSAIRTAEQTEIAASGTRDRPPDGVASRALWPRTAAWIRGSAPACWRSSTWQWLTDSSLASRPSTISTSGAR
jgi:hypothetical protein